MLKAMRNVSMTYVAYVLLLLAFIALGLFVFALAAESPLAGIFGISTAVLMAVAVVGFRTGARIRAKSNDSGIDIPGENIWAQPLRRAQIDRYMRSYRDVRDNHDQLLQEVAVPGTEPTRLVDRQAA